MIIHELTHDIESYSHSDLKPGWPVEGIADYTRWCRSETEHHATPVQTKISEKSNHPDAY